MTPNGTDDSGNAIIGYKWWNFAYPTLLTRGTSAISTTSGSATLVYQVDRTNGIVTVNPVDITTSAGLGTLTTGLAAGTPVKVYGVPQTDGTLRTYVLTYFTGEMSIQ
jgi:hypothetical protein